MSKRVVLISRDDVYKPVNVGSKLYDLLIFEQYAQVVTLTRTFEEGAESSSHVLDLVTMSVQVIENGAVLTFQPFRTHEPRLRTVGLQMLKDKIVDLSPFFIKFVLAKVNKTVSCSPAFIFETRRSHRSLRVENNFSILSLAVQPKLQRQALESSLSLATSDKLF